MTDEEITPERRIALLGAALHAIAWQLVEYETDTSDRGVSEEHYRDALERATAILPTLMPGVVAEEPEWERKTDRGFGLTEILVSDYQGQPPRPFTVQQSSLATECKVWIGVGDTRAHMSIGEATRVRDALNAFLADAWVSVEEEES